MGETIRQTTTLRCRGSPELHTLFPYASQTDSPLRFTVTGPGSGHSGLTLLVVRTGISQARACALWVLRSCSAAESSKFKELFTL